MRYTNPIIPGFHPDPSICRAGEDYYLVTSSFEYFPGVPLFHSRDLVHWRQIGHCLTRKAQLPLDNAWISGGIYAPTIRHHAGRFHMITTNTSDGGNFFVCTDDIDGEWSDPIWLDKEGIDPDLFFDDDGAVYYTLSRRTAGSVHIGQCTIDIATGKKCSEWRNIWEGTGGLGPEGPHVYKINGTYYLMIAEGGTEFGHMETVARGPSASGPWESCPRNPILTHRSSGSPIQATGHADLVQTPGGHWFMVCLGIRPFGYHRVHVLGRETFLAPVTWDADGWPRVGDGRMIALEMESDHLPAPCPWPVRPVRDDFDQPVLGVEWNFIRNPIVERYSLTERPGWLTLYGGPASLDRMEWPTFAGRRQEQLQSCASTLLDFASVADGEEAGLTVFQNYDHHYEIAVVRRDGANQLICRRRIGDLAAETASMSAPANPLHLRIRAEKDAYCLEYGVDGTTYHCMDKGRMRYLSTEVGGRFTGVYFGLYATGNGKESSTPARFDWFTDRVSE
ncbi:family 43 glycosylhydrolase [bacterium]|nr:family 43 glycosylhydrolase [bacterium]